MTLLARRVAFPAAWAAAEDEKLWENGDFPPFLMDEVKDATISVRKQGMSFFAVSQSDVKTLKRLSTALLVRSNNNLDDIRPAHFKFVDTSFLDEAGITYNQSKGDLGVADLDALHYDVTGITGKTAILLTQKLCFSDPVEISPKQIADQICDDVKKDGKFQRKDWPSAKLLYGIYKTEKLFKLARVNHRFVR